MDNIDNQQLLKELARQKRIMAMQEQKRRKDKNRNAIIFLLLLLLIIFGVVFLVFSKEQEVIEETKEKIREANTIAGILPGMDESQIQDQLNLIVDKSMFNVSINPNIVFEEAKIPGPVRIQNVPGNQYDFTVALILTESNETIMETGLIKIGHYLESRELDVDVDRGNYLCLAYFTAYDPVSGEEVGATGAQVLLTVMN